MLNNINLINRRPNVVIIGTGDDHSLSMKLSTLAKMNTATGTTVFMKPAKIVSTALEMKDNIERTETGLYKLNSVCSIWKENENIKNFLPFVFKTIKKIRSNYDKVVFKRTKWDTNVGTIKHMDYGKMTLVPVIIDTLSKNRLAKERVFDSIDNMEDGHKIAHVADKRHYAHVNCPNYADYIKNMITGAIGMITTKIVWDRFVRIYETIGLKILSLS